MVQWNFVVTVKMRYTCQKFYQSIFNNKSIRKYNSIKICSFGVQHFSLHTMSGEMHGARRGYNILRTDLDRKAEAVSFTIESNNRVEKQQAKMYHQHLT